MPRRSQVVITDFITEPLDYETRILGDVADIVALNAFSEEALIGRIEDADAILLYHFIGLSRATITRLRHCRLIVRCGVGYDNVDCVAAREHGITVANVPDYGTEDVADSAIGMALTLARGIHYLNSRLQDRQGPWIYTQVQPIHRLRGRVFGIIGLGRIGTAAALRAKALGMEVLFYDPYVPQGRDKSIGIQRAEEIEELFTRSHIVSLHCPNTTETRHVVNQKSLTWMPAGSFLVNTARGALVDAHAVLEAVTSGHLGGAALDVLEREPPLEDDALMRAWRDPAHPAHHRILINPHSAFYSEEGLIDMRVKGSQNCRRVLLGQLPFNVVN